MKALLIFFFITFSFHYSFAAFGEEWVSQDITARQIMQIIVMI